MLVFQTQYANINFKSALQVAACRVFSSNCALEGLRAHSAGGSSLHVTAALDAWSVGVLALEMFSGQSVCDLMQTKEQVRQLV